MRILITGSAGNLGGLLARHLLANTDHVLNLMIHEKPVAKDLAGHERSRVYRCDLGDPRTLEEPCSNSDVIIHFAGVLFAPGPERFLPVTNTLYTKNLVDAALTAGVKRFIINSFPHVEGPTSREDPCTDRQDRTPISVHARTRLAAEVHLFQKCKGTAMRPISLRTGMVYGRDVLMFTFARKLARKRLLAVWREPLSIHVLSIDDFNACCQAAIENQGANGFYPLGDEAPLTLQELLDTCCEQWGLPRPWRVPLWSVYFVASLCETFAKVFRTPTPFTVDFIRIGTVPYFCDTSRMRRDLLPELKYRSLMDGRGIL